ncbi:hypothetical protein ACKA01_06705 [Helcococcus kunzii]|uniref:hypothetical protein n=2 Tax=Helcococcus kunzii TaxID=40091 RepID=UPI0038B0E540
MEILGLLESKYLKWLIVLIQIAQMNEISIETTFDSGASKICKKKHNQIIFLIEKIRIGENDLSLYTFCRSFLNDVLEGQDYESEEND